MNKAFVILVVLSLGLLPAYAEQRRIASIPIRMADRIESRYGVVEFLDEHGNRSNYQMRIDGRFVRDSRDRFSSCNTRPSADAHYRDGQSDLILVSCNVGGAAGPSALVFVIIRQDASIMSEPVTPKGGELDIKSIRISDSSIAVPLERQESKDATAVYQGGSVKIVTTSNITSKGANPQACRELYNVYVNACAHDRICSTQDMSMAYLRGLPINEPGVKAAAFEKERSAACTAGQARSLADFGVTVCRP